MKITKESHRDHGLTKAQVDYITNWFAARAGFFIETISLPPELGTVPCGIHGPIMGQAPVAEAEVFHKQRGARTWTSRLVDRAPQQTSQVTVIAGPAEVECMRCNGTGKLRLSGSATAWSSCHACESGKVKETCVLYTAYGGPESPQEPGDPGCKDPVASKEFWSKHALSAEP